MPRGRAALDVQLADEALSRLALRGRHVAVTGGGGHLRWWFLRADLELGGVLVVVRTKYDRSVEYGVLNPLEIVPLGANTGAECATVDEWANEIVWNLDEEIKTGVLGRAQRVQRDDGVTRLVWR